MKKKSLIRLTGIFLSVAFAAAVLRSFSGMLSVSAASTNEVLTGVDSRVLASCLDVVEDDFNRATVDWTVTGASPEAVTRS